MIIGILNIRGGGSIIKRKRIGRIIKERKVDVFMMQETKMEEISELGANRFRGRRNWFLFFCLSWSGWRFINYMAEPFCFGYFQLSWRRLPEC